MKNGPVRSDEPIFSPLKEARLAQRLQVDRGELVPGQVLGDQHWQEAPLPFDIATDAGADGIVDRDDLAEPIERALEIPRLLRHHQHAVVLPVAGELHAEAVEDAGGADLKLAAGRWESKLIFVDVKLPGMPPEMAETMMGMAGEDQKYATCLSQEEADNARRRLLREGRRELHL